MVKRIFAITVIFAGATVAWIVLGATIFDRTFNSDSTLRGRVVSTWGMPQTQRAPTAAIARTVEREVRTVENGVPITRREETRVVTPLPLEQTRIEVAIDLDHRQKGLLWYSTYTVDFSGRYIFRNTTSTDSVTFTLPFPAKEAMYDNLVFTVNGTPVETTIVDDAALVTVAIAPGATATLGVGYRSQGLDEWQYDFGGDVAQVRDFLLTARTDFEDVDFPASTLSPTRKSTTDDGWALEWRYTNLLSGYRIGIEMPDRAQPGPLAGRISFFAPVSLFFFFFLMFMITTLRGIELHPMNYFFLAAAFFSFHLLLAYLVDHIPIHAAMIIASMVSVGLVVSYLRLVIGQTFAFRDAALAQLVYLVLFSYAFFFPGVTGLAITIISVLTLFVVMQMTGRVRWAEKFA